MCWELPQPRVPAEGQKGAQREGAAGGLDGSPPPPPPPAAAPGSELPLLTEPPVLLPVGTVDLQQRLQVLVVRLHILVVHVDVVQLPLLLKNLLGGACGSWASGGRTPEDGPTGNQPDAAGKRRAPGDPARDVRAGWGGPHTHRPRRTPLPPGSRCRPRSRRRKAWTRERCPRCRAGRRWLGSSSSTLRGDGGGEAARAPPAPPSQPAATFSELSAPPRRSNPTDMFQSASHEALLSIWRW